MLFKMSLNVIGSFKPQPNIIITVCAHLSFQIIWFSIELFTSQVTLKMKKVLIWFVLGLTFYMTKPDLTLHTSTLRTYCLFWHGTEASLGICSRYPEGDRSSFSSIAWLGMSHTKSKYSVSWFLGGYQRRTHGWSSAYRGNWPGGDLWEPDPQPNGSDPVWRGSTEPQHWYRGLLWLKASQRQHKSINCAEQISEKNYELNKMMSVLLLHLRMHSCIKLIIKS